MFVFNDIWRAPMSTKVWRWQATWILYLDQDLHLIPSKEIQEAVGSASDSISSLWLAFVVVAVIKEVFDGTWVDEKVGDLVAIRVGEVMELVLTLDETKFMLGSSRPQLSFSDPRPPWGIAAVMLCRSPRTSRSIRLGLDYHVNFCFYMYRNWLTESFWMCQRCKFSQCFRGRRINFVCCRLLSSRWSRLWATVSSWRNFSAFIVFMSMQDRRWSVW